MYALLFSLFFLFKQNAAYEMRISDWSSDVCSSALLEAKRVAERRHGVEVLVRALRRIDERPAELQHVLEGLDRRFPADAQARKSVVEGKSVAVRVDLGGGRSIKKKKEEAQ